MFMCYCPSLFAKRLKVFHSVSDQYKTQEICDRVVPEDPFMLIYCPDR